MSAVAGMSLDSGRGKTFNLYQPVPTCTNLYPTCFLSPLAAGFKVCQVCLARVYRGFWVLNLCTTRATTSVKPRDFHLRSATNGLQKCYRVLQAKLFFCVCVAAARAIENDMHTRCLIVRARFVFA
jgi:hypothetical protein